MNVLITGAAGYIGGSVLATILSRADSPVKAAHVTAAVRSEEQAKSLAKLGVNVVLLDLANETAANEVVLRNEIDVIVHTASSLDARLATPLIKALGQHRRVNKKETFFIHTSVANLFSPLNGWPFGDLRDSDPIFEKQKQLKGPHPVRDTNIIVTDLAKAEGVKSFNIAVPTVYGVGSGEVRKLSASMPAYIRTSIKYKAAYKFDEDGSPPMAHISDLADLYVLLLEKVVQHEPIPADEKGNYFALAHKTSWWAVMKRLAEALHARGLVNEPTVQTYPSDEVAGEYLGFPVMYVRAMGVSSGELIPVNAYKLGWQPKWDREAFLKSIDDEIQAVLDLDSFQPSVFETLMVAKS